MLKIYIIYESFQNSSDALFKSISDTQLVSNDIQPKDYKDGFQKLCNNSKYVLYSPQIEVKLLMDQSTISGDYCPVASVNTGIQVSYSLIVSTKDSPYSKLFNKK